MNVSHSSLRKIWDEEMDRMIKGKVLGEVWSERDKRVKKDKDKDKIEIQEM